VAKLQAASVPIAMGQTDRQTDGPQYRLMSRTVGQGIVIFFIHQRVVGKQQYTKKNKKKQTKHTVASFCNLSGKSETNFAALLAQTPARVWR